jgi:hypothetical protein
MAAADTQAVLLRLRRVAEREAQRNLELRRGEVARARVAFERAEERAVGLKKRLSPRPPGRKMAQLQREAELRAAIRGDLAEAEAARARSARALVDAAQAFEAARGALAEALKAREAAEALARAMTLESARKRSRRAERAAEELTRPKPRR